MAKKLLKLEVGTRVAQATTLIYDDYSDEEKEVPLRFNEDEAPEYGAVSELVSATHVKVKWDNEWYGKYHTDPVEIKKLDTEESIKVRWTALEKEYLEVEKEIKEKMKEAAKLVKDAQKIAKKKLSRNLEEIYDATGPLVSAMDASGWRSSSWGC